MADVVQTLLDFPPGKKKLSAKEYDTQAQSHLQQLLKIPPSSWNKPHGEKSLLEYLDPSVNSMSYIMVLNKQIDAIGKDSERFDQLYKNSLIFLASFDTVQLRYVAEEFRILFEWVYTALQNSQTASYTPDITPLVNALLRLDPCAATFTSHHLSLVTLALRLGVPSQVLPILDRNIYAYPQKPSKHLVEDVLCEEQELSSVWLTEKSGASRPLSTSTVLEYYLLGAQIYIGMRRFSRARLFLEYILLSPTQQHGSSALQVEAYKKWVLVGLFVQGKSWPVPRTMDQVVLRTLRALSKEYDAIADDFEKRDINKFQAELETAGEELWQEDGNLRLVTEVHKALNRYRIIDLQNTYAALPVARVAELLEIQPQQTLQLLADTIKGGYLQASLSSDSQDAVVRFHSSSSPKCDPIEDLAAQTERIHEFVTYVRDADRRLQLTKEYVEHQKRSKRAGGPDDDLADAMDLTWDAPMRVGTGQDGSDDEDLMV